MITIQQERGRIEIEMLDTKTVSMVFKGNSQDDTFYLSALQARELAAALKCKAGECDRWREVDDKRRAKELRDGRR